MANIFRRTGADYCVVRGRIPPWGRRTSSGWSYRDNPPRRYTPGSSQDVMRLVAYTNWIMLVREGYDLKFDWTLIAKGKKCDLWELYLAHARMMASDDGSQ